MRTEDILYQQHGSVGVLTLNRPHTRNAITRDMMATGRDVISELAASRSIRALVVTGAGAGFCSGADLGSASATGRRPLESSGSSLTDDIRDALNPFILGLSQAPFPVIAALNGVAAGAGVGLALACDLVIASRTSKLVLRFSEIGMGLDGGTSWFLAHTIGLKRAAAIAMLAEPIPADMMYELGIAWRIVDDDTLLPQSIELAQTLSQRATRALGAQKQQLQFALGSSLQQTLAAEAVIQGSLVSTEDAGEGIRAFRERRTALFKGN